MKNKLHPAYIKVALIESDPLRFVGFRSLLGSELQIEHCSSVSEVPTLAATDVVLLSNHLLDVLADEIATLRKLCPSLPILVLGAGSDDHVLTALTSGARGYVPESAGATEFLTAIRAVKEGSIWASRRLFSVLIEQLSNAPSSMRAGRPVFTNREKEVLDLLATGCCNKDIANTLGIEVRTVKAHVGKLMHKAGVKNRVSLCIHAVKHSLTAEL